MASKKIDSLTSLRFIACAAIVIHHSKGVLFLTPDFLKGFALDQAVSLFFVLSGFVLAYNYKQLDTLSSIKRFYVARFARIWPLHLTAFIALFVAFLPWSYYSIKKGHNGLLALLNITLVNGWIPIKDVFFSFNAVTWAVSAEVFFYLSFPFLIKNFQSTWRQKLAGSLLMVATIIVACNYLKLPSDQIAPVTDISRTGLIYINPLSRLFEFILGMSTALLWTKYGSRLDFGKMIWSTLEITMTVLAIFCVYFSIPLSEYIRGIIGDAGSEYVSHVGACIAFSGLIFFVAAEKGLLSRILRHKGLVLVGEASYAIFLFHQIMLRYYASNSKYISFISPPLIYAFFWMFLVSFSILLLIFIEKPCRDIIIRLYDSSRRQEGSSTVTLL